ncbi:MAG: DegT/DnrJ/EryC1/StrS family aminotransferase [Planctomycetota bacterium]
MKVPFFKHNVDETDIANVADAMRGEFLTTGERVARFESALAAFAHRRHAVGLTSATAGLHLALVALGIGPGDEVITTPMSFVATANAIVLAGATPVFADVEGDTGNIDVAKIQSAVTERTKAVLPVHLYGVMCDMRRLRPLADRFGLAVLEDAAHALEAQRDGVRPGELSDAAGFSFYATKSITSGEGGAIVTDRDDLAEKAHLLRLHGISSGPADRHGRPYRHYDLEQVGFKYNMSNIQAAMLEGQLPRADAMRARREELALRYRKALQGAANVELPSIPDDCISSHHLFTVRVPPGRRDDILAALERRGVSVAVNYRPIHLMSFYRREFSFEEGMFPEAERIGAATISLPLYPGLTEAEVDYVTAALRECLEE